MNEWIKIRVPADLKAAFLRYAKDHDTTISALLRQFMQSLTDN